jgi:hypothetical protein
MNQQLWRRLFSSPVTQRFYPQCTRCSAKQAQLLAERTSIAKKLGSPRRGINAATKAAAAVFHPPSLLRPPNAVGGVIALASLSAPHLFEATDAAAGAAADRVRVALRNLDTGFDKSAWPEWAKRALKRDHERD